MAKTFGEQQLGGDDLCDLCLSSGVNASRTTPCGKTIGVECGCDESRQDGLCGDESCEDCCPPYGDAPSGDDEDEEADDLATAALLLAQAGGGLAPATLYEALDRLGTLAVTLSHESRCPARHPAGECLCVRGDVLSFLHDHDRES